MKRDTSCSAAAAHLPLKPAVFYVLLALARQGLHGYGVIQAVRELSEGRVLLQTAPLYRHLRKLLDGGLVRESRRRAADDDPRRGVYYCLTPLGREVLRVEARRLAALVSATEALGFDVRGPEK